LLQIDSKGTLTQCHNLGHKPQKNELRGCSKDWLRHNTKVGVAPNVNSTSQPAGIAVSGLMLELNSYRKKREKLFNT